MHYRRHDRVERPCPTGGEVGQVWLEDACHVGPLRRAVADGEQDACTPDGLRRRQTSLVVFARRDVTERSGAIQGASAARSGLSPKATSPGRPCPVRQAGVQRVQRRCGRRGRASQ